MGITRAALGKARRKAGSAYRSFLARRAERGSAATPTIRKFALPKARGEEHKTEARSFARGYLICPSGFPAPVPDGWQRFQLGKWVLFKDPLLAHELDEGADSGIVVLGRPVTPDREENHAGEIAQFLHRTILADSLGAIDEPVTWLGGRFIVFAAMGSDARVHVDATASKSAFWAQQDGQLIVGSHSALVASAVGDETREKSRFFLTHPDYKSPAGKWLPGTVCPEDAVKMVVANCCLSYVNGKAQHHRFFPPQGYELPRYTPGEAADILLTETRKNARAELGTGKQPYVALTAGSDSDVMVRSALEEFREAGTIAITYHKFEANPEHSRKDLLGANRRALELGIPHLLLDLVPASEKRGFLSAYRHTFRGWSRFPALACLFANELSRDGILFLGIGPEVGTAFYQERGEPLNASVLASKYTQSAMSRNPELIEEFERYIEYTDLKSAVESGIDFYDLFYWESRLSGWAAGGYAEYELALDVALPFNSRRILEAMLSLSFEERKNKKIYACARRKLAEGNNGLVGGES